MSKRFNVLTHSRPTAAVGFLILTVSLMTVVTGSGKALAGNQPLLPHLDQAAGPEISGEGGGFVPPRFQTAHYADAVTANLRADKSLPASYDTRPLGWVTPVKNQGECGACYAFSSAADLESKIARSALGVTDLSENSMKECHYQGSSCDGGNQYRIMHYLATVGAVDETCDPYDPVDVTCTIGCIPQWAVLDFSTISGATVPAAAVIKQYLLDYGPIHTTLFAGDDANPTWRNTISAYNGTGALYYTGTETPNHSVVIVGWDDAIAHAGGTGAWIVKNSWGTSWGGACGYGSEGGYCYIAYGSASVGMYSSFVKALMPADPDMDVLYHDEGGFTSAFGGVGLTLWGMEKFTAPAETKVHRVEFWTTDVTPDVDVFIYSTFSGGTLSNLVASSVDHSFAEPGYHFVELAAPLNVGAGQTVYVAVQFQNGSYQYPLAADADGVAATDASYYSFNGAAWSTLESYGVDGTIRIRTSTDAVLAVDDPSGGGDFVPDGNEVPRELTIDSAWPNPFNPTTNITYHLPRGGHVLVAVYDLKGRKVRTLVDGEQRAGSRTVLWDGRDDAGAGVSSGVYFCRVFAADRMRGIKLALLK
ncbi:MAG: C1 family peptidase [bacterium]